MKQRTHEGVREHASQKNAELNETLHKLLYLHPIPILRVIRHKLRQVHLRTNRLLVERLGVGGSGRDVGVTSGLVGAGGLLEGLGSSQVSVTGGGVLGGVAGEAGVHGRAGKGSEHG